MKRFSAICVPALLCLLMQLQATNLYAQRGSTQPHSSPAKTTDADSLSVTNATGLRKLVGKRVNVTGQVKNANQSRSGHHFLNFYDSQLTVICFKQNVGKFGAGGPAKMYRNKDIRVSGKLELYQGKLQIKLVDPAQIQLIEKQAGPSSGSSTRVQLQEVAKGVWESPAGLRYAGRDPQGNSRVEHVLRHARDIPKRAGSHGVFDGGEDGVFGVIDDAWTIAEKKRLKPRAEGDRSTYLVSMGRRVGYLGGQNGAQRGNPPLRRVFIVFETGTKNIITAFPR